MTAAHRRIDLAATHLEMVIGAALVGGEEIALGPFRLLGRQAAFELPFLGHRLFHPRGEFGRHAGDGHFLDGHGRLPFAGPDEHPAIGRFAHFRRNLGRLGVVSLHLGTGVAGREHDQRQGEQQLGHRFPLMSVRASWHEACDYHMAAAPVCNPFGRS